MKSLFPGEDGPWAEGCLCHMDTFLVWSFLYCVSWEFLSKGIFIDSVEIYMHVIFSSYLMKKNVSIIICGTQCLNWYHKMTKSVVMSVICKP